MVEIPTLVDNETFTEIFDKVIDNAQDGIVIVEVGLFVGGSICYMSQKLQEKGVKHTIIGIDNFKFKTMHASDIDKYSHGLSPYIAYNNNIRKAKAKVMTYIGDSIEISKLFKDNVIDFLFLDGDHSKEYVVKEMLAWLPKMKENSMIAGHDFQDSEGVQLGCKLVLKKFCTTSTKSSYYKTIGEGIMPRKDKEEKRGERRQRKEGGSKIGLRFMLWLFRGWGYLQALIKRFTGG